MSKNYMVDVAKMLGVEVGEEFKIKNGSLVCKFGTLHLLHKTYGGQWLPDNDLLIDLLNGLYEIEKTPWKPKDEEDVYMLSRIGSVMCECFSSTSSGHALALRVGNFFKTKEEAEKNAANWLEYLNGEPDLSWRVE